MQVDQASETVLVPLYGVMVPFHILMVRNISSSQEGDHAYIRLNFNFGPSFEPCAKHPTALFLKELSFRTADSRHSTKVALPACVRAVAVCSRLQACLKLVQPGPAAEKLLGCTQHDAKHGAPPHPFEITRGAGLALGHLLLPVQGDGPALPLL